MSAKSVELANLIVTALNDPTNDFEFSFQAVRKATPFTVKELEDAADLRVSVMTGTRKSTRSTRGTASPFAPTFKPVISVIRPLNLATNEANLGLADQLSLLLQQIENRMEREPRLGEFALVSVDEDQDKEEYIASAMKSVNVFAAEVTLEFLG